MPLLILGTVVFTSVILYIYMLQHGGSLITKKAPPKGASKKSNVIYLPADLESRKNKTDNKD